jgi:hypothetical protein
MLTTFFLIHLGSTWFMVGLIWIIQIVHYPLFARVGNDQFVAYEREHSRLITYIVAPLMLTELVTGLGIAYMLSQSHTIAVIANTVFLAAIWISTFAIHVPLHQKLESGFDPSLHNRLVSTNWIRTISWSARGILLACLAPFVL